MGILNITPDSFFDGGKHAHEKDILKHVEQMLVEGATFIDVGTYSSRPNAKVVTEDEELSRIIGPLVKIIKYFPEATISIDTFRSRVALECLELGAAIINDISGGAREPDLLDVVAKYKAPYILMHMRGTAQNMVQKTDYENVTRDVLKSLSEKVVAAKAKKINDIIIDPGFGFAKTLEQNYELLNHLELFKSFDLPLLVGVSRKSMIYRLLDITANEALNATTALNTVALMKDANIIRVHDVKEAVEATKLVAQLKKCS
jgi:dihydropteroate synthase